MEYTTSTSSSKGRRRHARTRSLADRLGFTSWGGTTKIDRTVLSLNPMYTAALEEGSERSNPSGRDEPAPDHCQPGQEFDSDEAASNAEEIILPSDYCYEKPRESPLVPSTMSSQVCHHGP